MADSCGNGWAADEMTADQLRELRRQGTPARLASRRAHYHRKGWLTQTRRRLRQKIERDQQRLEEL